MHSKTLKTYELSDGNIARIGYMIEENDDMKRYKVIYGFSIVDEEVLQLAFYMDNDEDLDWAMDTWKKITKQ